MTAPQRLLSTPEAARRLGVSDSRMAQMRREGTGPQWVKVGRNYRYPQSSLDTWHREYLRSLGVEVSEPVDDPKPCPDCARWERSLFGHQQEIKRLEYDLGKARDRLSTRGMKIEAAIADQLFRAREINAVEPHKPHVYVLWSADGEAIYVGQSRNVLARVGQHARSNDDRWRMTAKVQLHPCRNSADMDRMERLLIEQYRPRFNVTHNRDRGAA